jgi:transposase InsO family protein
MPWQENSVSDEKLAMYALHREGRTPTELAQRFGVSRAAVYRLLERVDDDGIEAALVERSRAPHTHPNLTASRVTDIVVSARRRHPMWGPRKLRDWLHREKPELVLPAASTIGDILKREGLIVPRRRGRKLNVNAGPCVDAQHPNDVWSIDFKGWFKTHDGEKCHPLTITDNVSRAILACRGVDAPTRAMIMPIVERTFREHGLPAAMLSDNGPPFGNIKGAAGLSTLSVWLIRLGVRPDFIRPGKPQDNGRHERMHRTLKAECPPCSTLRAQQRSFNAFVTEFNEERPHDALGGRTPSDVHVRSLREFPKRLPEPEYDDAWEERRVSASGFFRWNNEQLFLSEAISEQTVALENFDDDAYIVHFGFVPLAVLDGWNNELIPYDAEATDLNDLRRRNRDRNAKRRRHARRLPDPPAGGRGLPPDPLS